MERLNLAGEWLLSRDGEKPIPGRLPGCTYLDYMANGMENPFWGENETEANSLARHDYIYSREFELTSDMLEQENLELVADGLDTLCTITLNGAEAGKTDNINRVWRLDVKNACREGKNTISIHIENPYPVIEEKQKADPLPMSSMPIPGVGQIRKTNCHFGWDWGPKLPPAGLARSIALEAFSRRVEDFRIVQEHSEGAVSLKISAQLSGANDGSEISGSLELTAPDGTKTFYHSELEDSVLHWDIKIEDPQLWWCNGLGDQPLYKLALSLEVDGSTAETLRRQIGLRTIKLDTAPDEHGHQFRFVINGVPIFAKGADWIPPDSFITRADRETMFFYAETAKKANMNMLRVWGGGMFENEDFYDACDENGILVWQDFLFACNSYPLHDPEYLENVRAEVRDNVRRLRHRASLALWCGNNENEVVLMLKPFKRQKNKIMRTNLLFYHTILRDWVSDFDGVTDYWPGSPSSGSLDYKPHNMKAGKTRGDTHLWQIWHGMRAIEAFREFPTRFCSEFGMESMPSMHTVRSFTDTPSPTLFEPVMQLHQKSTGGNEKILYYLLAKYRNPAKFEDYIYLSQLVQANTVRFATDCWRRNMGKQNGAIFWQMNDCWPVASWAGVDYERQLKAVTYMARHFNKPLCISNDYFDDRAELYVTNEYPESFAGTLEWRLKDFSGGLINSGSSSVRINAVSSQRIEVLRFNSILKGRKKSEASLEVRLLEKGEVRDEKYWLLVPDKDASLPAAEIKSECSLNGNTAAVKLSSPVYARYVYAEAQGVTAPWSDNFMDIPAGESATVTVELPEGMSIEDFRQRLRIKTLADVEPANSPLKDKWLRIKMIFTNRNYISWLLFKILLG